MDLYLCPQLGHFHGSKHRAICSSITPVSIQGLKSKITPRSTSAQLNMIDTTDILVRFREMRLFTVSTTLSVEAHTNRREKYP
jgi:hypothetical protein